MGRRASGRRARDVSALHAGVDQVVPPSALPELGISLSTGPRVLLKCLLCLLKPRTTCGEWVLPVPCSPHTFSTSSSPSNAPQKIATCTTCSPSRSYKFCWEQPFPVRRLDKRARTHCEPANVDGALTNNPGACSRAIEARHSINAKSPSSSPTRGRSPFCPPHSPCPPHSSTSPAQVVLAGIEGREGKQDARESRARWREAKEDPREPGRPWRRPRRHRPCPSRDAGASWSIRHRRRRCQPSQTPARTG